MKTKTLATALLILVIVCITYVGIKELTHKVDYGKVIENRYYVAENSDGYIDENRVILERVDGSRIFYINEDDWICGKRTFVQIRDSLVEGSWVKVTINGFGNILRVEPAKEPECADDHKANKKKEEPVEVPCDCSDTNKTEVKNGKSEPVQKSI